VAGKWLKYNWLTGYVVVELGQKAAPTAKSNGGFYSRLCAIGGGQISIPNMFQEWQYK
jgi:hypothetical protein